MEAFARAVAMWAALMGEPAPPVYRNDSIPNDGRACQVAFSGYGPIIECAADRMVFKLSDKSWLARHEMCHVRLKHFEGAYSMNAHGNDFVRCMDVYRKRLQEAKRSR